jgi:hypothetical protein
MASFTQPSYSTPRPRVIWGGGTDPNTTQSSLTTAALALAADGLPVFPCNAIKKPIVDQGFKNATRDPETIRAMFAKPGAALIGVPTGHASGRVVIDVDPQHNGDAWLRKNKNRLPSTLTHGTPRGGEHLAFRDPPDVEIRNSQGRIAPGVDVRGTGGYVIVPPSEGYTIKHNGPLAEMPQWCTPRQVPPPHENISRISVDTRAKAQPSEDPLPPGVGATPQPSAPNGGPASASPPTMIVTAGELHISWRPKRKRRSLRPVPKFSSAVC